MAGQRGTASGGAGRLTQTKELITEATAQARRAKGGSRLRVAVPVQAAAALLGE